ncbi:MAG: PilZ domain-containing protein [Polyangia bacterium]|jgi:hypothetical protein
MRLERPAELRRAIRAKVRLPARYASESLVVEGVVTDVSPDGLFFCSDYLDGAGELARISLDIPWDRAPLELRGQVRWASDAPEVAGMGIKLFDLSLEDRMVLSSLGVAALGSSALAVPGQ